MSYIEAGGSTRFLHAIIRHFAITPLAQIDQEALDRGARKLFPKASGATRNRQFFTPTSAVLHHAARRGWCPSPIIERPVASPERVRWLTIAEADALLDACAVHLRPLVLFMLYAGARAGEAVWLEWRQVDLSRAHVSFPKTKNGEARGVPLHPRLLVALADLPHRDGEVFRKPDGRAYARPKRADDTSAGARIKTAFRAACRRAGIEDLHPHDCRHTWATWHYASNRNLGALMRLGGWKSVRMVMRYAHVNVDEFADTIDRLPGGILGEMRTAKGKSA
ncbi:MAG TPA: site-specific integrase [Microvirga sp.]|nr:site-specific integrase [Microvirga sp.]